MEQAKSRPRLPWPLAKPLGLMPERVQGIVAAQVLNRAFARERVEGELEFLLGKSVRVEVEDAGTAFCVGLTPGGFKAVSAHSAPDLSVAGTPYASLLLITGREDPDTLFFQRRLRMQGDTELGVYLKNFLASVDPATLPLGSLIQPALQRSLTVYERLA